MATKQRANRVLTGSHMEVWINGDLCFETEELEAKVTIEREDVLMGSDVDSKMTKQKGEGKMVINQVYTRFEDVRKAFLAGKDLRVEIIGKLQDPDAVGGGMERYSIGNVWFNELPLVNWKRGEVIKKEYPFGFTPSDLQNLDHIPVQ